MTTSEEGERGHLFYIWREGDSVRSKWEALSKKALKLQPIHLFYTTSTRGVVVEYFIFSLHTVPVSRASKLNGTPLKK